MKKSILLIWLSFIVSQNPVSNPGLDQIMQLGETITLPMNFSEDTDNENLSFPADGNIITSYNEYDFKSLPPNSY